LNLASLHNTVAFKSIRLGGGKGTCWPKFYLRPQAVGPRDICQNFGHHVGHLHRRCSGAMEPPTSTSQCTRDRDKCPVSVTATKPGTGDGRIDSNTTVLQICKIVIQPPVVHFVYFYTPFHDSSIYDVRLPVDHNHRYFFSYGYTPPTHGSTSTLDKRSS